jgi:hypothetical protein
VWEEDRNPDGHYAVKGNKALPSYRRSNGKIVGLWKYGKAAVTADDGLTWSKVSEVTSLKIGGQQTSDGQCALASNPVPSNHHRWPLAVVTGDHFNDMLAGSVVADWNIYSYRCTGG